MAGIFTNRKQGNVFLRMHPLQRILLSLAVAITTFLFIRNRGLNWELTTTALWDAFAFSFIFTSWIVLFTRPLPDIIRQANKEDGSSTFVLVSILTSSLASMFTVSLLMVSNSQPPHRETITLILAIAGMMLSWAMVHTIFTFHYAHLYYDEDRNDTPNGEAINFPGEKKPDYIDFAYFAFVIGMTFQVSDAEICSGIIRRTVLAHSLIAFVLNTFVVALTINLVAGLGK